MLTQAESIQQREELLQEMELVSQLTVREFKQKDEEHIRRAEAVSYTHLTLPTIYSV